MSTPTRAAATLAMVTIVGLAAVACSNQDTPVTQPSTSESASPTEVDDERLAGEPFTDTDKEELCDGLLRTVSDMSELDGEPQLTYPTNDPSAETHCQIDDLKWNETGHIGTLQLTFTPLTEPQIEDIQILNEGHGNPIPLCKAIPDLDTKKFGFAGTDHSTGYCHNSIPVEGSGDVVEGYADTGYFIARATVLGIRVTAGTAGSESSSGSSDEATFLLQDAMDSVVGAAAP